MFDATRLKQQQANNLFRVRKIKHGPQQATVVCNNQVCLSFCSNDYLALANHPKLIKTLTATSKHYGVGSGASQLVSGHHRAHQQCEQAFADFLQRDRALLFANGYMANLGVLSTFGEMGGRIFQDQLNHASLLDGGQLAKAKSFRYRHLDVEHLKSQLQQTSASKKMIVSDSVFSSTGQIAPLPALCQIADDFKSLLIVDEAHSIGVFGENGGGVTEHFQLTQQDIPILICPLGKAFGGYGAIVAGEADMIEHLIQFARSYIYTTALPATLACTLQTSLYLVQKENWRRQKLHFLIKEFKTIAHDYSIPLLPSKTPIQTIPMPSCQAGILLQEKLLQQGYWVGLLRPPSVSLHPALIRITLSTGHTRSQIKKLLDALCHEYAKIKL